MGCVGCHQMGQRSIRTLPPKALARSHPPRRRGSGESRPVKPADRCPRRRRSSSTDFRSSTSPIGRTASPPVSFRPRRPSGRTGPSATSSQPSGTGPIRRRTCTTFPARIDGTPLSTDTGSCTALRSSAPTRSRSWTRSQTPPLSTTHRHATKIRRPPRAIPSSRPHRTGTTKRSGTARRTSTTRCSTTRAGCGSRPGSAGRTTPISAGRGRNIPRLGSTRRSALRVSWPCSIRRRGSTRSSIPASPPTISSSGTTRTTRSGRAAIGRWSAG